MRSDNAKAGKPQEHPIKQFGNAQSYEALS
jgi:hypothetical protein